MKKILAFFLVFAIASLIVSGLGSAMKPRGYMTPKEATAHSDKVGIFSAIIYGGAFVVWRKWSQSIQFHSDVKKKLKKLDSEKKEQEKLEKLEEENRGNQELADAVVLIDYGVSGYGKCPKCGTNNSIGRQTCFGCGVSLKPFETQKM